METERSLASQSVRLCVCVATFRRPVGLTRLLRSLGALRFSLATSPSLEIVVVDNDSEGSAAATCRECGPILRWPIIYLREPRRGIAFARNRAVRAARLRGADLIAFVDDDEVPEPAWLDELLAVLARYQADVVTGPVLPVFEGRVPGWMLQGRFFESPRRKTGTRVDRAATNNVLVRAHVFSQVGGVFDEGLALTGGEDTEFFLRVSHAGCQIVWADSAIVNEWTPETRTRTSWLLRRAYKVGTGWGCFKHALQPSGRYAMRGLAKGLLLLPLSFARGRHAIVSSLQLVAVGVGFLVAKAGFRFDAYRRTDGR